MKKEVIRVEPLSTYLENWKAPTSAVTRSGDTIYVSGFPPFDPDTGKVIEAPIERQTELVLEQMKLASRRRDRLWRTCSSATCIARRSRNLQRSHDLRQIFPQGPARSDLCLHSRMAGTVRYRSGLHRRSKGLLRVKPQWRP
jgi:hypothetical protein